MSVIAAAETVRPPGNLILPLTNDHLRESCERLRRDHVSEGHHSRKSSRNHRVVRGIPERFPSYGQPSTTPLASTGGTGRSGPAERATGSSLAKPACVFSMLRQKRAHVVPLGRPTHRTYAAPCAGLCAATLLHSVLLWVGPKVFMPWVSQNPVSLPSLRVSHFGHMHSSEKEAGRNPRSCRTGCRALV